MLPIVPYCHLLKSLSFGQEMLYFHFSQSLQVTANPPYFNSRGIQYD